jgi:hypothetical protein
MKLNKIVMLTLIAAAFASRVDAYAHNEIAKSPAPKKVKPAFDENGKKIDGSLDVMRDGKWVRFEKSEHTCAARDGKRPKYQFATPMCAVLNVVEKNGTCMLYYPATDNANKLMPNELTPDEKETIMLEDVFQD